MTLLWRACAASGWSVARLRDDGAFTHCALAAAALTAAARAPTKRRSPPRASREKRIARSAHSCSPPKMHRRLASPSLDRLGLGIGDCSDDDDDDDDDDDSDDDDLDLSQLGVQGGGGGGGGEARLLCSLSEKGGDSSHNAGELSDDAATVGIGYFEDNAASLVASRKIRRHLSRVRVPNTAAGRALAFRIRFGRLLEVGRLLRARDTSRRGCGAVAEGGGAGRRRGARAGGKGSGAKEGARPVLSQRARRLGLGQSRGSSASASFVVSVDRRGAEHRARARALSLSLLISCAPPFPPPLARSLSRPPSRPRRDNHDDDHDGATTTARPRRRDHDDGGVRPLVSLSSRRWSGRSVGRPSRVVVVVASSSSRRCGRSVGRSVGRRSAAQGVPRADRPGDRGELDLDRLRDEPARGPLAELRRLRGPVDGTVALDQHDVPHHLHARGRNVRPMTHLE